ncbi:hypothetical protein HB364_14855 [Pseudoflavitalea sp. X16]|uniref:hypothetical protein n=1 Tax=Paraflavitalea devenefica TaxID=2716334 RepID=UPI00142490F2|nr:hypothetical protein [Paraflavitalea devenefica]NII26368.1 hypothetical protein [Paraflavitalea devenefica]
MKRILLLATIAMLMTSTVTYANGAPTQDKEKCKKTCCTKSCPKPCPKDKCEKSKSAKS